MQSPPPPALSMTTKLDLSFGATKLLNLDRLSKSDPMLVIEEQLPNQTWTEVGRTECIKNNLDPTWTTAISVNYAFEKVQMMKISVYDVDKDARLPLHRHDLIGWVICRLADIVSSRGNVFEVSLQNPKKSSPGFVRVTYEECKASNLVAEIYMSGTKLAKKDRFGKSDPYFVISQQREGGVDVPCCQSAVIKKTLNPKWEVLKIPLQKLCNGDIDRPLIITVFDWDRNGSHDLIGFTQTSVREMAENKSFGWELRNPKKKNKSQGRLNLLSCELIKVPSFVEYVKGGLEFKLVVAVDYTGSNGNPRMPSSLHYQNPFQPNEYARAIRAIGDTIAPYDPNQMFAAYGFGACVPPQNAVSHCFPLTFNPQNPYVCGVKGLLDSYVNSLNHVTLYGPTLFSQILNQVDYLSSLPVAPGKQQYFVVLILTDGVINDFQNTIDRIVHLANNRPVSVIIAGVGNANFDQMVALDGDDGVLRSTQQEIAKRDIVQFVPFRQFQNMGPDALSSHTLEEVPRQVVEFFKQRNILPNTPAPAPNQAAPPPAYDA